MIRTDFVSNSSSSSFMIVGVQLSHSDIIDLLEKKNIKSTESLYDDANKLIEAYNLNINFEAEISDDPWNAYFGLNYMDMKDDETKKEFKQRIQNETNKISNDKVEYFCEGGYNG